MAAGLLALGPLVDGTDAPLNAPALPPYSGSFLGQSAKLCGICLIEMNIT
jgi:hypothetical protein